uniref:Uncharacterized protein n=1 Tax=Arundo donax TaxID=35708 RepID=A0A0A8ZID5_ARUDO
MSHLIRYMCTPVSLQAIFQVTLTLYKDLCCLLISNTIFSKLCKAQRTFCVSIRQMLCCILNTCGAKSISPDAMSYMVIFVITCGARSYYGVFDQYHH